jgi:hypothetical protein
MNVQVDRNKWNNVAIETSSSPLFSWEWAQAKELSGRKVDYILLNEKEQKMALPVTIIKSFCGVKMGWIPYGIGYKGELSRAKIFLKHSLLKKNYGIVANRCYDMLYSSELFDSFFGIRYKNNAETLILELEGKTEEELFANFNATTRKHIRRAYLDDIHCENMNGNDFQLFWDAYLRFVIRKGFRLPYNENFFFSLIKLTRKSEGGLSLIAKKAVKSAHTYGYLIALKLGNQVLEFLRFDDETFRNKAYGPKLLTWEVVREALKDGACFFDFGGVEIKKQMGIYQFKRGFGGKLCTSPYIKFIVPIL